MPEAARGTEGRVEGVGLGLRLELAEALFERAPAAVRWLEIHPENYLGRGGRFRAALDRARARWPIVTHGLTMGFATTEPADQDHMRELRRLLDELDVPWHSDHLCFAGRGGVLAHELLPAPHHAETLETVVSRLREAEDVLGRPIAVENVSYYAESPDSTWREIEFVLEVLDRTSARLLLDVNNVYVNSRNHGFDPRTWIDQVPAERVVELHVAGHFVRDDGLRVDTHAEPICDEVLALVEYTLERIGPRPVLLERDGKYPPFEVLEAELRALAALHARATTRHREREVAA